MSQSDSDALMFSSSTQASSSLDANSATDSLLVTSSQSDTSAMARKDGKAEGSNSNDGIRHHEKTIEEKAATVKCRNSSIVQKSDFCKPQSSVKVPRYSRNTTRPPFVVWAKDKESQLVANAFAKDPNLQWSVDQCGNNLFHGGCEVGNISLISYLLKKLPDGDVERLLGSFNRQGLKPFHVAVSSGMCHIIKLLSKFSPQLAQETTRDGSTAVHLAVQANCRAALSFLVSVLDQDFIWSRDASGATPLHLACVEGSAALVLDLLRVPGASVNVLDGQGQSCLHIAVILGHFKLCQTLLSLEHPMKALMEQPCRQGNTALHYACSNQQYSIVKLLLEHGANAQARNKMKLTPVEVADNNETIEHMISRNGFNKGPRREKSSFVINRSGSTSIEGSDSECSTDRSICHDDDIVTKEVHSRRFYDDRARKEALLELRTGDTVCSNVNDLLLFEMVKSRSVPELQSRIGSAQSGLKRNVNLIRDSESGGTLLHLAAKIGYLDTVQFLVEGAGAEVDCQDDHGMTPLHCAVEFHHIQVSRYLVQSCGAKLDVRDHDGDLALDVAVAEHADDIARLLRDEFSRCQVPI